MRFFVIFLFSIAVLGAGCGKKAAVDPPRMKSRKLINLYDHLSSKDHQATVETTSSLREMMKGNLFLDNLRRIEQNNIHVVKAQEELEKGNLEGALIRIRKSIADEGRQPQLLQAEEDIKSIIAVVICLNKVKQSSDALSLMKNIIILKKMIASYPPAAVLNPYIESKTQAAKRIYSREKWRAINDLCSDIEYSKVRKDSVLATLLAELAILDPNHQLLKKNLPNQPKKASK